MLGGKVQEKLIGNINFIVESNFNQLQRDAIKKYLTLHNECSYIKLDYIRKRIEDTDREELNIRNSLKFIE